MAETSTIFGFMKYVSATDILSDFKKTVDSHFVNSLKRLVMSLYIDCLFNFKHDFCWCFGCFSFNIVDIGFRTHFIRFKF